MGQWDYTVHTYPHTHKHTHTQTAKGQEGDEVDVCVCMCSYVLSCVYVCVWEDQSTREWVARWRCVTYSIVQLVYVCVLAGGW